MPHSHRPQTRNILKFIFQRNDSVTFFRRLFFYFSETFSHRKNESRWASETAKVRSEGLIEACKEKRAGLNTICLCLKVVTDRDTDPDTNVAVATTEDAREAARGAEVVSAGAVRTEDVREIRATAAREATAAAASSCNACLAVTSSWHAARNRDVSRPEFKAPHSFEHIFRAIFFRRINR